MKLNVPFNLYFKVKKALRHLNQVGFQSYYFGAEHLCQEVSEI